MANEILYPLTWFRRHQQLALPDYELLEPGEVPEPYRSLLVHRGDMTSRLESFHHGSIHLEVLNCEHSAEAYRREVILFVEPGGRAVEYGAIEINLAAFDGPLRDQIVEGRLPLGGLLNRYGIEYHSEPVAFIRMQADAAMAGYLRVDGAAGYYGRSNVLLGTGNMELARIVELLPPIQEDRVPL